MNVHFIDTRQGTDNQHSFSNGNTLPLTGLPHGMNYFAPQTNGNNGSWWFNPNDRVFQGFRLTHQPSPWMGDFSYFVLLPFSGSLQGDTLFHAQSSFRPEESTFKPHYLEIDALRYKLTAKMVPSMYGGILKTTYRQKQAGLLFSLPGKYTFTIEDSYTVSGSISNFSDCEDPKFKFYFTLAFKEAIVTNDYSLKTGENDCQSLFFGDIAEQTIQFGTSFISLEQAKWNLAREKDLRVEEYLQQSEAAWQTYLDKIEVKSANKEHVETFYHAMYRAFLFPQKFYELNEHQKPIHYDTLAQEAKPGVLYTNNGFWDTFRSLFPLYSLIAVDDYEEMLEGFLNSYKESGYLPKWLSPDERGMMPGTLIDGVIADAATKDIRLDLMPAFFEGMLKGATIPSEDSKYGRQGTADYLKYGYLPTTHHESVNHTQDYCYSDFCISKVAEVLNQPELVKNYQRQARNYLHVFDEQTGFMRAKDGEGHFREPFDAHNWGRDYAEGSAWQNGFAVYHDFAGLIEAYGGNQPFLAKLIELCNQEPTFHVDGYGFEIHEMSEMAAVDFGQIALSNQPSFHLPYLFSYAGKPEFAQPLLKQLMTTLFSSGFDGYPGDEDNGSLAAWYIFSSLGFYPVCPGSGEYVIGIPLFDQVTVHLSNGKKLEMSTAPNQTQQQFIHTIHFNEEKHDALFFQHQDLIKGGVIDFQLGIVPNPKNYTTQQLPFSMST